MSSQLIFSSVLLLKGFRRIRWVLQLNCWWDSCWEQQGFGLVTVEMVTHHYRSRGGIAHCCGWMQALQE